MSKNVESLAPCRCNLLFVLLFTFPAFGVFEQIIPKDIK